MNLFELFIRIGVDDQASDEISGLSSKLGNGLKTAAKIGAAAVSAAGTAIVAIGKQAIEQYAEYEQLVGGVETLFKQSADTVMGYAENAYKTAGMSANEYMNTVTSFSASLLQSLGGDTEAAAKYADMAITDMSDNANKMGTDMEMIQNAYQGFAKQNYTMLDNLKLGYGGTKEEMQRLLEDAEKLSGIEYDISSYADIVDAIHVVQTEMGITGTTAKEASTTIQGSLSSMKSAWQNLLTGVADDNADFDGLVNNFVDSLVGVGENIIPRINTVIQGLTQLISQSSETIIPMVVETLLQNLPAIVAAGMDLIMALVNGIIDNMDVLIDSTIELIDVVVDKLIENLPKLIDGGVRLIIALAGGLIKAIPKLVGKIPEIISAIVNGFKSGGNRILDVGKNIVQGVWEGIKSAASWIRDKVTNFFGGIVDDVKDFLGIHSPSKVFASIGGFMAEGLGEGFEDKFAHVKDDMEDALNFGDASVGINASIRKAGVGAAGGAFGTVSTDTALASEIKGLRNDVKNLKIYLSTGALVGGIVDGVDQSMGTIYSNQQRREFA